jgi:hypothetical protein
MLLKKIIFAVSMSYISAASAITASREVTITNKLQEEIIVRTEVDEQHIKAGQQGKVKVGNPDSKIDSGTIQIFNAQNTPLAELRNKASLMTNAYVVQSKTVVTIE